MKNLLIILIWLFAGIQASGSTNPRLISFDFFGQPIHFELDSSSIIRCKSTTSEANIRDFYNRANGADFLPVISALKEYKAKTKPNDWLFYQLIRKTSQHLCPKSSDYLSYTLYKWYFLLACGYDAIVTVSDSKVLLYVQCDESIYNIPFRKKGDKQYVCLNYHDYGIVDFTKELFREVTISYPSKLSSFSYLVTQLPSFNPGKYSEKNLHFSYQNQDYLFKVKVNPDIQSIFANYPVLDYNFSFNIPISRETYSSLIPALKKNIKGLSTKSGVDYLMKFTRYAFGYEKDIDQFGKEKRLTPEETLLYNQSDCEDRAALFFYLVKEIYDLPMIVLSYPTHVTVAVHFKNANGKAIIYKGDKYYICEPTPQAKDLQIGEPVPSLAKTNFDIAYAYNPGKK